MRVVEASAPCRADLAGGTLDIWPLGLLSDGSSTVNAAIPLQVRVRVDRRAPPRQVLHAVADQPWRSLRKESAAGDLTAAVCYALCPEGGLRVRALEQAPIGSGLGGSSAYGIALSLALLELEGRVMSEREVVALVRDLEARVLVVPTGTQDHWAALLGGVLALHLEPGGEHPEELAVDQQWLGDHLTVFFTGITHHSGMVNWQVFRRRFEGDVTTTKALTALVAAARKCRKALLSSDELEVGLAIAADWQARKQLAPEVCPPEVERLETVARDAGALAVKACGAGGGGSILLWHVAGQRDDLCDALGRAAPDGRVLTQGVTGTGAFVTNR